jgi:hypothetical protein
MNHSYEARRNLIDSTTLYMVQERKHMWRIDWRRPITDTFQPRIGWWRFRTEEEARLVFSTFGTPQEPSVEWAKPPRWWRQGWHRVILQKRSGS